MRILLLCEGDPETNDSWSGTSRSVLKSLRALGHEVIPGDVDLYGARRYLAAVLTFSRPRGRWWSRYHLGAIPFRMRSARARALGRAYAGSVDAILQFGATFSPPDLPGVPVFLYCDSNIELARLGQASGFTDASHLSPGELASVARREKAVYDRAALVMTFSQVLRDTFVEHFGLSSERVLAVGGGPNLGGLSLPPDGASPAESGPVVLFVGRQFERKGGDLLLRAFDRVRSRVPAARLVIVGPDTLPEGMAGTPPEGVEFLGFLDKDSPTHRERLSRAYATARVFCLPTRFEPYGVSFLEAMRFGLPCVGPRAWAVPEMVKDGDTGILVDPEDVVALADAMERLLLDEDLARRMGEAGRRLARERFTWERIVRDMAEAMQTRTHPPAGTGA